MNQQIVTMTSFDCAEITRISSPSMPVHDMVSVPPLNDTLTTGFDGRVNCDNTSIGPDHCSELPSLVFAYPDSSTTSVHFNCDISADIPDIIQPNTGFDGRVNCDNTSIGPDHCSVLPSLVNARSSLGYYTTKHSVLFKNKFAKRTFPMM